MTSPQLLACFFILLVLTSPLSARMGIAMAVGDPSPIAKCWSYDASPDLSATAAVDGSNIYFLDSNARMHAVDMTSGTKLWSSDLGGAIVSDLLVSGSSVFIVTSRGDDAATHAKVGTLRSISPQTGITNWITEFPSTERVSIGTLNGTVVTVTGTGHITAFSRENGATAWNKDLGVRLASAPVFEPGAITVITANNEVLRIGEKADLTRVVTLDHAPTALISQSGGRTLVGDERGNLTFISSRDKRVWSFKNGARIAHILAFDSEYIVASDDNFIYKLNRRGDVEWKRRLSGRTSGVPILTGNSVVASVIGEGDIYVIDARNGKVLNRIDIGEGISAEVFATVDQKGFTVLHPQGLIRYGEGACGVK